MFSQVTQIGSIYQIPPAIDSLQWCKIVPKDVNLTLSVNSPDDIDFDRLLPTLFEVFAIVFCGFLAGRCNLISATDIKGLNDFTTYFSLPPLIFLNLVTINFYHVNWLFILGILLGKIVVFLLVAVVTASVQRPTNLSYAGIYGIFCTQGNDFGLAYPIVASLYGSKRPLYPGYMYLIAPTSLLFLNPMGFILMEAQKNKNAAIEDPKGHMGGTVLKTVSNVSWNIIKNPIVFVTLLGVFGNFLFHGGLPSVLFGILQILSSAFSGAVLFLLGFSVARTGESKYSKKEGLLIPSVLLITKMIVSPLIIRSCVSMLCAGASDVEDLADFGFLYGMVPTGPIVMLFAAEYGLRTEMMASTMVLCTGLFGPVVFVLARMLSLNVKGIGEFSDELRATMLVLSILSFISCLWIGLSLIFSKKMKRQVYKITGGFISSQIILALGILIWSICQSNEEWTKYLEIALISAGQLMTRVWVTILAVTMVLLRRNPCSSFVQKMFWPYCIGIGFPGLIVVMILIITGIGQCEPDLDKELPLFIYGSTEAFGSIVVLVVCITTTTLCLVLYFRSPQKDMPELASKLNVESLGAESKDIVAIPIEKDVEKNLLDGAGIAIYKIKKTDSVDTVMSSINKLEERLQPDFPGSNDRLSQRVISEGMKRSETSFSEKHLLSSTDSENSTPTSSPIHTVSCKKSPSAKEDISRSHLRHVILLILNLISMAVGLTISTWKLSTNQPNGLFVAMEFLDAVLNVGQGVFVFIVFIKDTKYILAPISKWLTKVRHGFYSLNEDSIDVAIQQQCHQFRTYHRDNCKKDLPKSIIKNDVIHKNCFTGTEFVDWLNKVGLASHRTAAENYGQRLYRGGVLSSVDGAVQFHDNSGYLYTLEECCPK
ncbi:lysosomal cholesterol signaling protein-like [Parasteatoda tepidariorum]|uniref:lysosomal cholesterol signaling protein-like n=1 Tax=Parasteatoda tepidariorum TaxID=114398 RepID=UPI00077FDF68|nr:integral membrane protein GPR155-like [Parasteatoda tepidariorum]XP_015927831.1 integral membrane protein GPR155-like [Parasteatoda tepidariorum]XP_042896882.1 integral membrane protein GPR155-like [Parasteatoda tepidariorum]